MGVYARSQDVRVLYRRSLRARPPLTRLLIHDIDRRHRVLVPFRQAGRRQCDADRTALKKDIGWSDRDVREPMASVEGTRRASCGVKKLDGSSRAGVIAKSAQPEPAGASVVACTAGRTEPQRNACSASWRTGPAGHAKPLTLRQTRWSSRRTRSRRTHPERAVVRAS